MRRSVVIFYLIPKSTFWTRFWRLFGLSHFAYSNVIFIDFKCSKVFNLHLFCVIFHVCWCQNAYMRAHVAKFYGRLRLICSVLRASQLSVLKLIEIVILWVYYTIPFGSIFFRHFFWHYYNFFNYFLWLGITDEGSIPEMRIWSIL